MRFFIDPGHGGEDPGGIGPGPDRIPDTPDDIPEKRVVLEIAELLDQAADREGWDRLWSRRTDLNVSERRTAAMANEWHADIFCSLHINAAEDPDANGFEVLHWHTSSRGAALAELVCDLLEAAFPHRPNRGPKPRGPGDRGATVLGATAMPAILVEPGFITNPFEEPWLQRLDTQASIAMAIVDAIRETHG